MARSEFRTWLSLDEFANIIGLHPLSFNQLHSQTLQVGTRCGETFFQQSWLDADRIGRDDIAMAIQQAEQEISREVGFNLMPDWVQDERLNYPRPFLPEGYGSGVNVRWMPKSVEAKKGHMISGGIRAKSLIQAGNAVVRTDSDGDGYAETCTIIVPTSVTDENEIHVYYPSQNGSDAWEVRPIVVSISGGNATITFKSWNITIATSMDALDAAVLDADTLTNYETTVDVYRVYNDPSTQITFLWENDPGCNCCGSCTACQLGAQTGCFHTRDTRMGFIVPAPAEWSESDQEFTTSYWSACREPDQVRVWYRSGYVDHNLARPYAELSNEWKYAIAYFACSKFERPVCGCSNVNQFVDKWRRDAAFSSLSEGGFTVTAEQAANRLGTSMGALYAYRQIQRNGVRINK